MLLNQNHQPVQKHSIDRSMSLARHAAKEICSLAQRKSFSEMGSFFIFDRHALFQRFETLKKLIVYGMFFRFWVAQTGILKQQHKNTKVYAH